MASGDLSASLDRLRALWEVAGAPIARLLAPPVPAQDVVDALLSVGLTAPSELVEWFGWGNGFEAPAGAGRYVAACGIAGLDYQSLSECLDELSIWRSLDASPWQPTWFPLLRGRSGSALVAVVAPETDTCRTGIFDPEFGPPKLTTSSIEELVNEWAGRIERGEIGWIERGGAGSWRRPPPTLPG